MPNTTQLSDIYHGTYINLAQSTDRRAYIQAHLQELGLAPYFSRFEAIDGSVYAQPATKHKLTNREKACFKSHTLAMERCQHDDKHLHIIEDDTMMHADTKKTLHHCLCENGFDDFDIIFCGLSIWDLSAKLYERSEQKANTSYKLLDLGETLNYAGLYSYIINKNSIQKILAILYKHKFVNSIDLVLRYFTENKVLRAYCLMPMLAKPNYHFASTIDPINSDRTKQHNLSERAFSHAHFKYLTDLFYKGEKLENVYHKIVASLQNQGIHTDALINAPSIANLMALLLKNGLAVPSPHHDITILPDP